MPNAPHAPAATHYVYARHAATGDLHRVPFVDANEASRHRAVGLLEGVFAEAEVRPAGTAAPRWYMLWLVAKETRLVHALAEEAERAFAEACTKPRPEMWARVVRAVLAHPAVPQARAIEEELLRG